MRAKIEQVCTGQGPLNLLQRPVIDDFRTTRKLPQIIANHGVLLLLLIIGGFYVFHFQSAAPFDQIVVEMHSVQDLDKLDSQTRLKCPCVTPRLTIAHALPALHNITSLTFFQDYCSSYEIQPELEGFLLPLCGRYAGIFSYYFVESFFDAEVRIEFPQERLQAEAKRSVVAACESAVLFVAERDKQLSHWRELQLQAGLIRPSELGFNVMSVAEVIAQNLSAFIVDGCSQGSLHDNLTQTLSASREALFNHCNCSHCSYIQYLDTPRVVLESLNKAFVFAIFLGFLGRYLFRLISFCARREKMEGVNICDKVRCFWMNETSSESGYFNLIGGMTTECVSMTHKAIMLWNHMVFFVLIAIMTILLWTELSRPRGWILEEVSDMTIELFNMPLTSTDRTPFQCECQTPIMMEISGVTTLVNDSFITESCLNNTVRVMEAVSGTLSVWDIADLESLFFSQLTAMCFYFHGSVQVRALSSTLDHNINNLPQKEQYEQISRAYFTDVVAAYDELLMEYDVNEFWSIWGVRFGGFDTYDIDLEISNIFRVVQFAMVFKFALEFSLLPPVASEVIPLLEQAKANYSTAFNTCQPHQCSYAQKETTFAVFVRVFGEVVVGFSLFRQALVFLVFSFCHSSAPTSLMRDGTSLWGKLKRVYCSLWLGNGFFNYVGHKRHQETTRKCCHVAVNCLMIFTTTVLMAGVIFFLPGEFEEIRVNRPSLPEVNALLGEQDSWCPCTSSLFSMDIISPQWHSQTNYTLTQLCMAIANENETTQCEGTVSWLIRGVSQLNFQLSNYPVVPGRVVEIALGQKGNAALQTGVVTEMLFSGLAQYWWSTLSVMRENYNLPTLPYDPPRVFVEGIRFYSDSRALNNKIFHTILEKNSSLTTRCFPTSDAIMYSHCDPLQCTFTQPRPRGVLWAESLTTLSAILLVLGLIGQRLRDCGQKSEQVEPRYVQLQDT